MKKLYKLTGREIQQAFVEGDVKAVDLLAASYKRIHHHDPKIGSFLSLLEERALAKAEALDRKRANGKPLGKLAGIPIGLKDNILLDGEITTCASQFLKNFRAPYSATAVRLVEEADALIVGKMNLDEFAMGSSNENSSFFKVKNPWDLERVPGGSSGGSAAAVAARLVPIAFGTDTGGSIRQPASFCGIAGFKPTYGRVSRYGLVSFGSSFDQIGPMATSVEDLMMMMEVIGVNCPKDATSLDLPKESYLTPLAKDLKEIRIGVPFTLLEGLREGVKKNFNDSLEKMKSLGAEVVPVDLSLLKYSIAVYYILATAEVSTNLARFDGIRYGMRSSQAKNLDEVYELSRSEGFGPEVKKRIMLGTFVLSAGYQDAFYKKAQKVRTLMIDAFDQAFGSCDLIATPVAPTPAFISGEIKDPLEMYLQDIFTIPANLAGLPAVSLPSGFSEEHLPLGLQLMGPQMHDVPLLRAAQLFEEVTGWGQKMPPAFEEFL
jgi:aspartyl-tRNA(Asn)/glutamyl-tRNA(Gln) amidotransferase subunit A